MITKPIEAFEPEVLIKETIEKYGDSLAVACSFGKDSIIVLFMALKYKPDIKVIFNNTGVEFPETLEYKEQMKKLWNLNLIETKPYKDMTFWKCADKYGLPNTRSNKHKIHSPRCCYYCKEKPAIDKYRELGIRAVLTGLTKAESRNRALLITMMDNGIKEKDGIGFCGQRYFAKNWGIWRLHPIAYWTEKEAFDYIKKNKIPLNPVYTKWNGIYRRCGCLPCTAYLDWEKKLSKTHPKLYRILKQKQNPQQKILMEKNDRIK
jgi:phosphoadenosine phosphosulfate reductase